MEKHIKDAMNDSILEKAGRFYNIELKEIKYHGGFENFIYVFKKDEIEYILRLVHSDHRIYDHVLAEIEFIDYLSNNGACVSTVYKSINQNIVERITVDENSYFTVTAFVRGLGDRIGEQAKDANFWKNLGEQIGLLHRLTKDFNPKHKRTIWYNETLYQLAPKILIDEEEPINEKLRYKIEYIKNLESNIDNFGLIHTDLHFGNMVIDSNDKLTFFDFDDSAYKHFLSDIAIVLFYQFAYSNPSNEIKTEKSIWILNNFMKGYSKNNDLPKKEFIYLNDFLKLRELTLYTVIVAAGEEVKTSEWGSKFLNIYRDKILNDTPFLNLEDLIKELDY